MILIPQVFPHVALFDSAIGQVVKVAIYVAVSAVLAAFITATTNNPQLFGEATVLINLLLVAVRKYLDPETPNLPS